MTTGKINQTWTDDIDKVDQVSTANIAAINGVTWADTKDSPYNGVIDYSVMFDGASNTYLTTAAGGSDNRTTQWTVSMWLKRSLLTTRQVFWTWYVDGNNVSWFEFNAADQIEIVNYLSGYTDRLVTTPVFRDCGGWYHLYFANDTTQATESDRWKLYINGVQITDFSTANYPALNDATNTYFFKADTASHWVGTYIGSSLDYYGYMADFQLIYDSIEDISEFGETSQGIWVPKDGSLTYGTEGIKLDFSDNTSFGDDTSGNANDLTDGNLGTDHQTLDTPEENFAIADDGAMNTGIAVTEGGTQLAYNPTNWASGFMTFPPMKTGKWYFEGYVVSNLSANRRPAIGIADIGTTSGDMFTTSYLLGAGAQEWAIYHGHDTSPSTLIYYKRNNGSSTDITADTGNIALNDVMQVAFDADNNKIWFGRDDNWTGDPSAGTGAAYDSGDGIDASLYDYVPAFSVYNVSLDVYNDNAGMADLTYAPPTGFLALRNSNLSVDVTDPQDDYVNVVTWEGDGGATKAITGVGFQPDFVLIKNRDAADGWLLFDSDRTATYPCTVDDGTPAEAADADTLLSFDADGFSVGADVKVNTSSESYIAYCLKKQSGFFDIQTFTGTGSAHAENHDLGVVPRMMIVWNRTDGREIYVYHYASQNKTDPETDYLQWDLANAAADLNTAWNDTAPTSTQFTVGTVENTNGSSDNMVAWLFADKEGTSKCFNYTGNGNAAGPSVYLGFRPQWIMIKNTDAADSWVIMSDEQDTYNQMDNYLKPDLADAEDTSGENEMDFTSQGFRIRSTDHTVNANNEEYIGIAFAQQPALYANAR